MSLEEDPPDSRQYNANIREERWTNFSLEGVRFLAMTADVIQRGEALAIFERDLIIHFPTDIKSRSSLHSSTVGRRKENSRDLPTSG